MTGIFTELLMLLNTENNPQIKGAERAESSLPWRHDGESPYETISSCSGSISNGMERERKEGEKKSLNLQRERNKTEKPQQQTT